MMKKLSTALLVIFMVLLITQFVRHAHVRLFNNPVSVIDRYNKKAADHRIDKSLSLKELSMIYADAEKRIKIFEDGMSKKERARYEGSGDPYKRKAEIEEMITRLESDHRAIAEIIFFWVAGLFLIAGGSFVYYKFEPVFGAPLVISGFSGMIWKTGPLLFMAAGAAESAVLLNVKLIFTALTLAGLIAYWIFFSKHITD